MVVDRQHRPRGPRPDQAAVEVEVQRHVAQHHVEELGVGIVDVDGSASAWMVRL